MNKIVQFGAGNIGRGFVGQLSSQSGWETVFIDIDETLLNAINERGTYDIHIVDKNTYRISVTNIRAVDGRDIGQVAEELATADLVSTAVGANIIRHIAAPICRGIEKRSQLPTPRPLNILLCENLLHAAAIMREHLAAEIAEEAMDFLASQIGLAETVIGRMVPIVPEEKKKEDPLYIAVEEFAILPIDSNAIIGPCPDIKGLDPEPNLFAFEERKLFTHNCGHMLCALWGYEKGYEFLWEAADDEEIRSSTLAAMQETGEALVKKHGFDPLDYQAHTKDLVERFRNKALGDTIARVARDPIRKLGPNDRLIGAANLCMEQGIEPAHLVQGIISAIRYDPPEDPGAIELQNQMNEDGLETVLKNICQLEPDSALFKMIVKRF